MRRSRRVGLVVGLAACAPEGTDDPAAPACAWEAGAHAGQMAEGDGLEGPAALGAPGDLMLANPHAAFVIQAPTPEGYAERSYVHYGGLPVDAVAMRGCEQAGPERFGELTLLPSRLDVTDFTGSVMRMLRGTVATVLSDGTDGGPAVVRVDAVDGDFWLVDHELTRRVAAGGGRRPLSGPMGIAVSVTYTLAPDQAALALDVEVRNERAEPQSLAMGAALFPDASTPTFHFADGELAFGGFGLQLGLPWFAASAGDGAYAFGLDRGTAALAEVSGVRAMFDPEQLLSGTLALAPAGSTGDAATFRLWLAVGEDDEASAIDALLAARPRVGADPAELTRLTGRVLAEEDGSPVAGARVDVEVAVGGDAWRPLHRLRTDADGRFAGDVAWTADDARPRRVVVAVEGRPSAEPVELERGTGALDLVVGEGSAVELRAVDAGGAGLPARASFYREGGREVVRFLPPEGERVLLPPGAWSISVARGYEHEPWEGEVELEPGEVQTLEVPVPRVVDTSGWLSFDSHVHAGPSPDSDVAPDLRFATAAADGLDVVVHTEHEIIVDERPVLAASRWSDWVASVAGQEVTATTPEHMNMVGVEVGPEHGPRGSPVQWYGLGMGGVLAAMAERGAGVRTLNHPRGDCGWMCQIDWDPAEAVPRETDPTRLGLPEGTPLWSWDFEAVELMNGTKYIFADPARPRFTGLFDDWVGFWHHGHRVTALAASDVHGLDAPGSPRSWVAVDDDDLRAFREADLVDGIRAGAVVLGAGAFARVTVDGARPGETVTAADGLVDVVVRVEAPAAIDVTRAVVFVGCEAVAELLAEDPGAVVKIDATVPLELQADALVVVAAFGAQPLPRGFDPVPSSLPRALTNPVLVDVDGNGTWEAPGPSACDYAGQVPSP